MTWLTKAMINRCKNFSFYSKQILNLWHVGILQVASLTSKITAPCFFFHFYLENVVKTFNDKDIPEPSVEITLSRLIFVAIGWKVECNMGNICKICEKYFWLFATHSFTNFQTCFPLIFKVENILKGILDSIPSPSPSVKIQIMSGKVYLRCKGKTLLGIVNKLLKTKSLLTSPAMFCLITSIKLSHQ